MTVTGPADGSPLAESPADDCVVSAVAILAANPAEAWSGTVAVYSSGEGDDELELEATVNVQASGSTPRLIARLHRPDDSRPRAWGGHIAEGRTLYATATGDGVNVRLTLATGDVWARGPAGYGRRVTP